MKAVVIHEFGPAEAMRLEDLPDPEPGPEQVLIRVRAASVNRGDLARRAGLYPGRVHFPYVLGWDVAGDVEAVGAGVRDVQPGQRVVAQLSNGGYAERAVADAARVVPIPDAMRYDEAATVPVVFLTAWLALRGLARLERDETVLVQAGAGGVGMAGIQVARALGARMVIATAGAEEKLAACRRWGAQHGVNYRQQDLLEAVTRLTGGAGVDVVLESVGGRMLARSIEALGYRGRLVMVGNSSGEPVSIAPGLLMGKNAGVFAFWLAPEVARGAFRREMPILAHFQQGVFKTVIDRTFPLGEAADAHRYLEERRTTGKVVLIP